MVHGQKTLRNKSDPLAARTDAHPFAAASWNQTCLLQTPWATYEWRPTYLGIRRTTTAGSASRRAMHKVPPTLWTARPLLPGPLSAIPSYFHSLDDSDSADASPRNSFRSAECAESRLQFLRFARRTTSTVWLCLIHSPTALRARPPSTVFVSSAPTCFALSPLACA